MAKFNDFMELFLKKSPESAALKLKLSEKLDDIVIDMQVQSNWKWAFNWDKAEQVTRVEKAQKNLEKVLQYEGLKQYRTTRDLMINAYIAQKAGQTDFDKVTTKMDVFAYFYPLARIKEIRITREYLDLLELQDPQLFEVFYKEIKDMMKVHKEVIKNKKSTALQKKQAMIKIDTDFQNVTTWIFFANKEGSRSVRLFRDLLKSYKETNPKFTIFDKLKFTRQNILDRRDLVKSVGQFKLYLREIFYQVNLGTAKWAKVQKLIADSYAVGLYDKTQIDLYKGFTEDAIANITQKADDQIEELEFWWFWIKKFTTADTDVAKKAAYDKVWKTKDYIEQLSKQKSLKSPVNGKRDYYDARKFNELAVVYRSKLERAKVTDDQLLYEHTNSEAKFFADKIYDAFWKDV